MSQQANRFSARAEDHFRKGYNCAQSVLLAMQEYYSIPKDRLIPRVATPFGGGIGKRGSLCGALTGAVIAIGLKHGTNTTQLKKKEESYKISRELYERFAKKHGSPFCRELIGYDLTNCREMEDMRKKKIREKKCSGLVGNAVKILIELETENAHQQIKGIKQRRQ